MVFHTLLCDSMFQFVIYVSMVHVSSIKLLICCTFLYLLCGSMAQFMKFHILLHGSKVQFVKFRSWLYGSMVKFIEYLILLHCSMFPFITYCHAVPWFNL